MSSTRWSGTLALGVIFLAAPATAAGCWEGLATTTAEMTVTEKFEATMNCMAEQGQQIEAINGLFSDAVLAFNRSETQPACPRGWSLFREAGGRLIVGAGQHENHGLSEYPSFKDDPNDATGGAENVAVTVAQMPTHRHSFSGTGVTTGGWGGQGVMPVAVGGTQASSALHQLI